RVLRVPGSKNHKKKDRLRDVTVYSESLTEEKSDYLAWKQFLPVEVPSARVTEAKVGGYTPAGLVNNGLINRSQKGFPDGKRHNSFLGAACWLQDEVGLTLMDTIELLWRKAQNSPGRRTIT